MYIDKIILKDVRGFADLRFDLRRPDGSHSGWTVFTGDNGSGTLLKAVAIALTGRETARALQPSFHRWIREDRHEAAIELGLMPVAGDDSFTKQGRDTGRSSRPARTRSCTAPPSACRTRAHRLPSRPVRPTPD
jgi:hypothetical protein